MKTSVPALVHHFRSQRSDVSEIHIDVGEFHISLCFDQRVYPQRFGSRSDRCPPHLPRKSDHNLRRSPSVPLSIPLNRGQVPGCEAQNPTTIRQTAQRRGETGTPVHAPGRPCLSVPQIVNLMSHSILDIATMNAKMREK